MTDLAGHRTGDGVHLDGTTKIASLSMVGNVIGTVAGGVDFQYGFVSESNLGNFNLSGNSIHGATGSIFINSGDSPCLVTGNIVVRRLGNFQLVLYRSQQSVGYAAF